MSIYAHLGPFSDLVEAAARSRPLFPLAPPGPETQGAVRDALSFSPDPTTPQDVALGRTWERDGVWGQEVSWSVGYGPRTEAWLLRPLDVAGPLPGVVALHDHGGFKYYGKEKIADGPDETSSLLEPFRDDCYGGRAWANALAREGFTVLVPDTFLWGSRQFPAALLGGDGSADDEIRAYNEAAGPHEHVVEKYCAILGATFAGVVSYEDRVAAAYLAGRADVAGPSIGCAGLSGGGCRAALLQATCDTVGATVVVGMMSTYEGLLDHNVVSHTWMFFPPGWGQRGDWTDLAACRAPSPLLVQYDLDDALFSAEGMEAAHRRLSAHYASVGMPDNYEGQFYAGPHQFSLEMQRAAFSWLADRLTEK